MNEINENKTDKKKGNLSCLEIREEGMGWGKLRSGMRVVISDFETTLRFPVKN